ncbi:MAG: hypothetical protein IPN42_08855 [Methylococcaceae bacterium]|nr:hypothetical protein [Methylococcaceae bacterium]
MNAPIASGWSKSCRVGLSPTGKRRLSTAHTQNGCWHLLIECLTASKADG